MVIGTAAYCGSGQDTLADGFIKYKGFVRYSLGDVFRDMAKERNLLQTRENLQNIREECDRKYGRTYVADKIVREIREKKDPHVIITGIRRKEEYNIFKRQLGLVFIFIYADEAIRFERMLCRGMTKDGKTILEIRTCMARENEMFDYGFLRDHADMEFNFNMKLDKYLNDESDIVTYLYKKLKTEKRVEPWKMMKKDRG